MAFFIRKKAKLCKNSDYNICFRQKRQFLAKKLSKNAENCAHNGSTVIISNDNIPNEDISKNQKGGYIVDISKNHYLKC
jgi:hypothetical protein